MLDTQTKTLIKQAFSNVRDNMPDFTVRFAQNKMIAQIANTLTNQHKKITCIEAPTGIGKTLSYLIAGIVLAKIHDKKLIISTATIALQEQIINKDIPDVRKYSRLDFSFGLIKGRGRYVCIRDLTHLSEDNDQPLLFAQNTAQNTALNKRQKSQLVRLVRRYNKSWDGEFDSLEQPLEASLWQKIQCNYRNCTAKQCAFYEDCCFFNARKRIFSSDVLVTNHDLVLADLNAGNSALPVPNEAFYIFDEAHHLPNKALNHFAYQLNINTLEAELNRQTSLIEQLSKVQNKLKLFQTFNEDKKQLIEAKNALIAYVENATFEDDIYLFKLGIIDKYYRQCAQQVFDFIKRLAKIIDNLAQQFEQDKKQGEFDVVLAESYQTGLNFAQFYYADIKTFFTQLLKEDDTKKAPTSRFIEQKVHNFQTQHILHVANIDISLQLNTLLWQPCTAAVLTSATLSSLGGFERLNNQLGLNAECCDYLRLNSPFKFSNIPFIVAAVNTLPRDTDYQETIAGELLRRLDPSEGSLVLFTANKQMQNITRLIEDQLDCSLMCQGEQSKQSILQKHKQLREQKLGSVIFGVDSFYEGVDLPGHYLTHLIIIKLRFNVPSTPLEKTMSDYLESQNQNAFFKTSLPDASLKLIQACGRLIRSEEDNGKITLFDRRIISKPYGKRLLDALPDFKIVIEEN